MSSSDVPVADASLTKRMMEKVKSIPKETYFVGFLIVLFIIIFIWYVTMKVSINTKQSRECDYINDLYPSTSNRIRSIGTDTSGNLFDYYIKTAYNCCSGGNYKDDYVDVCILKGILKGGTRCLDFEIYNIENEPVVATSTSDSFYVKETFNFIPFTTIMELLNSYAFSSGNTPNPTDPLLIHLRMKSNSQTMFSNLAKIFKKYPSIMLGNDYSYENSGKNIGATPVLELQNKVLVIADKSNSAFLDNDDLMEYINLTSNSVFMREYRYTDVKNISDLNELQEYNKKSMTIVLPDKQINPPNPSGILCREAGCQMVAMRYQFVDSYLEENALFFDDTGYAFVLKPENLRYKEVVIDDPKSQNPDYSYETKTLESDYYSFNF